MVSRYDTDNNLKKLTPSNFVFGKAKVNGRPVIIGGDDFTVEVAQQMPLLKANITCAKRWHLL